MLIWTRFIAVRLQIYYESTQLNNMYEQSDIICWEITIISNYLSLVMLDKV